MMSCIVGRTTGGELGREEGSIETEALMRIQRSGAGSARDTSTCASPNCNTPLTRELNALANRIRNIS